MINIKGKTKPISALKLIHNNNHCKVNNVFYGNSLNTINELKFNLHEPIHNLNAGLYKFTLYNISYIINVFMEISSSDYLVINNLYDIKMVVSTKIFNLTPYKYISNDNNSNTFTLNNTVNDSLDIIYLNGKSTLSNTNPSLDNNILINRINNINIKTKNGSLISNNIIPLKYTLGSLDNGIKDNIVIDNKNKVSYINIKTTKELLSAGYIWELIKENINYYIFFAKNDNIVKSNDSKCIRCTALPSVNLNTLLNDSTNYNCIAVTEKNNLEYIDNGIWIKINKNILNISSEKDPSKEFKKWLINNTNNNKYIYIEYELNKYIYHMVLLDNYDIKTYYKQTFIESNLPISVCYKSL